MAIESQVTTDQQNASAPGRCVSCTGWSVIAACLIWAAGYQTGVASEAAKERTAQTVDRSHADQSTPLQRFFQSRRADDESDASVGDGIRELSVPPSNTVVYPEDRPAWIDSKSTEIEGDPRFVARAMPRSSPEAAEDFCRVEVDALVRRHAESLVDDFHDAGELQLAREWIEDAVVRQTYEGPVHYPDGETAYESAALLVFDEDVDARLTRQIQQVLVRERLIGMAAVTSLTLGGLMVGTFFMGMVSRRMERRRT